MWFIGFGFCWECSEISVLVIVCHLGEMGKVQPFVFTVVFFTCYIMAAYLHIIIVILLLLLLLLLLL